MRPTTSGTKLVCVLGHPVAHSVSPQLHSAAFASLDVDARYLAFDVAPAALDVAVAGLSALGFLGANVTVPHKEAVVALADELSPEAELVGAANTLYWAGGRLVGHNTDASGLLMVLRDQIGLEAGEVAVVYGAGGVARAAAVALGRYGARVRIEARRPEAAAVLQRLAEACGALPAGTARARLAVNATSLGLHGERLPGSWADVGADQVALDLVYGAAETPFVADARAAGARAFDGLELLVAQAADSFTCWTGVSAPISVMRDAALTALGRSPA